MSDSRKNHITYVSRRGLLRGTAGLTTGLIAGGVLGSSVTLTAPAKAQDMNSTIRVGAALPLTGIFSGDGEEFRRGFLMAIDEINNSGGLAGHKLEAVIVDAQDTYVEQVSSAFERLVRKEKVDVAFAGFFIGTGVEFDIVADAGIPYISQQAKQHVSDIISSDRKKYRMMFQTCPTGRWYGLGFADFLRSVPDSMLKHGKTVAVLGGENGYSNQIIDAMRPALKADGWEETVFEVAPYGIPDWTPTLTQIRNNPPSVIACCTGIVGDDALFLRQFSDLPTKSLLYQVFTPSTPEFLEVTGKVAEGVVWSSVIGILPDKIGADFRAEYRTIWNGDEPSFAAAGPMYDQVLMWATAARIAGDPTDNEKVSDAFRGLIYRGVSGAYHVQESDQTVPSYPTQESDPSLGLPHMFYQVTGGKHLAIWPSPYTDKALAAPPWMA